MQDQFGDYLESLQLLPQGDILKDESVPTTDSIHDAMEFIESDEAKTAITKKQYTSALTLYNDLKLAVTARLVQEPIGSDAYQQLGDFFKFAVGLLARETASMPAADAGETTETSEPKFGNDVTRDMEQVVSDFDQWNGQAYFIIGQTGPLFSSTGKQSIDPRPVTVHGSFQTTDLVQIKDQDYTYRLGSTSQKVNEIPHPALAPTEMMNQFVHPINASVPSSKWLKFDSYSSYAPATDTNGVIIDDTEASSVWFEKVGAEKLTTEQQVKEAALKRIKELEEEITNGKDHHQVEPKEAEEGKESKEAEPDKMDVDEPKELVSQTSPGDEKEEEEIGEIDFGSLLAWRPGNSIDNDEMKAAADGTEQQLASRLILQLQQAQRVRLAQNNGKEYDISLQESDLAAKLQRVLQRIVGDTTPSNLDLQVSSSLPVLQTVYNGALPAPERRIRPQPRTYTKRK